MRFHFLTILALLSLCATESKAGEYDVSSVTELRAALSQAARDGGSNIISISSGHFEVADGDGPLLFVPITSASVLLRGAGIYETVLDGGQIDQILVVSGASSIIIEDLSMVNGRAPEGIRGGALFVQNSSLEVRRVRFAGNESSTGGAIATHRY